MAEGWGQAGRTAANVWIVNVWWRSALSHCPGAGLPPCSSVSGQIRRGSGSRQRRPREAEGWSAPEEGPPAFQLNLFLATLPPAPLMHAAEMCRKSAYSVPVFESHSYLFHPSCWRTSFKTNLAAWGHTGLAPDLPETRYRSATLDGDARYLSVPRCGAIFRRLGWLPDPAGLPHSASNLKFTGIFFWRGR